MTYQWDNDKATANLRKHGIDFADAVSVFSDDLAITIPDQRFGAVYHSGNGCLRSSFSSCLYVAW